MKEFKLQVPDGLTKCNNCPFVNNISVCLFLRENEYCINMETNFNFKSQIATSREQSERLLALGLKKETADMCYFKKDIYGEKDVARTEVPEIWTKSFLEAYIPAWSLHRLIEMINEEIQTDWESMCLQDVGFTTRDNLYDNIVDCIEWLIKEGYFNKEYLEETL